VDPLTASYPWLTPYQFAGNTPIESIDIDGMETGFMQGSDGTPSLTRPAPAPFGNFTPPSDHLYNNAPGTSFPWGRYDSHSSESGAGFMLYLIGRVMQTSRLPLVSGGGVAVEEAGIAIGENSSDGFRNPDLELTQGASPSASPEIDRVLNGTTEHAAAARLSTNIPEPALRVPPPTAVTSGNVTATTPPSAPAPGVATSGTTGMGTPVGGTGIPGRTSTSLLNPPINVTQDGMQHIMNRHGPNQLPKYSNKSQFSMGETDIRSLLRTSSQQPMTRLPNGTYVRNFDTGSPVGTDRSTNTTTNRVTIFTRQNGNVITAHPGNPTTPRR
jgi:hypothetical protein